MLSAMHVSRVAAVSLLLMFGTLLAWAVKSYDGRMITIGSSLVNEKGVRLIYAQGSSPSSRTNYFMFSCNEPVDSCRTPEVGKTYILSGSARLYECDEYVIGRSHEPDIVTCLVSVF
jgi:hypothetical protein